MKLAINNINQDLAFKKALTDHETTELILNQGRDLVKEQKYFEALKFFRKCTE